MKARLLTYALTALVAILIGLRVEVVASRGIETHALKADYIVFLTGGTLFAQGHHSAAELYNIVLQSSVQQQLLAGSGVKFVDGLLPFVHPPLVAAVASPLSALSPALGFILWDTAQLLLLLLSLWLMRPLLPVGERYWLWLGAFAFFPVYQSLLEGQISPTLLLSIVLLWRCLRVGGAANWWAGVSLALGLIKPHLIILFVIYLLYKRNWRALSGFTVSAAALYLLTTTFAGFDWPFVYLNTLGWLNAQINHYGMLPQVMFNWHSLLARFGLDNSLLLGALIALTLIALGYACWRSDSAPTSTPAQEAGNSERERVGALELQLAATTLATAITSVYLYTHDLIMLLFSGAVLLGWAAQQRWPIWISTLLIANLLAPMLIFVGQPLDALFVATILLAFAASIYILTYAPAQLNPAASRTQFI